MTSPVIRLYSDIGPPGLQSEVTKGLGCSAIVAPGVRKGGLVSKGGVTGGTGGTGGVAVGVVVVGGIASKFPEVRNGGFDSTPKQSESAKS